MSLITNAVGNALAYCFDYHRSSRTVNFLARAYYNISVEGLENIPGQGGGIIASKHSGALDIPLSGAVIYSGTGREVPFFSKIEYRDGMLGKWMERVGTEFVDRKNPSRDSLVQLVDKIEAGKLFIQYPEGTRTPTGLGAFKRGIAYQAAELYSRGVDVPVIPEYIEGTGNLPFHFLTMPRHKMLFRFGEPLYFRDVLPDNPQAFDVRSSKKAQNEFTRMMREKVLELSDGNLVDLVRTSESSL